MGLWVQLSLVDIAAIDDLAELARGSDSEKALQAADHIKERVRHYETLGGENYRAAAQERFGDEGRIEVDDDATVSVSENGAYVMGWLWVPDEVVGVTGGD